MSITATLDGVQMPVKPTDQTLAQFENLSPGQHSIIIETVGSTSQSLLNLDGAIVDLGVAE
jgi:hypothetical protein